MAGIRIIAAGSDILLGVAIPLRAGFFADVKIPISPIAVVGRLRYRVWPGWCLAFCRENRRASEPIQARRYE
jgi:hypothetical protein